MSRRTLPSFTSLLPLPHRTRPVCVFGVFLTSIALSAGCGGKDSVALSVFMSSASLEVAPATLGSQLSGGFNLGFELGPEASGDTVVSLESFTLAPSGGTEVLVPTFAPTTEEVFPITLKAGEKRSVAFSVSNITLSADQLEKVCTDTVEIRTSVRDSLSDDGISAVRSGAISVAGCP